MARYGQEFKDRVVVVARLLPPESGAVDGAGPAGGGF